MRLDNTVHLYPLTYVIEGEDVSIGRFGTDTFAVFSRDGAELLKRLEAGMTLSAAATWYETTYGEDVDMVDFLDTLQELNFLCADHSERHQTNQIPWQRLGRWMFSPFAWLLYALLAAWCVYDLIRNPALIPHYNNIFFSPYLLLIEIVLFVGQYPGAIFHEMFHILAGRRCGLPSRLRFGRRMYYFVLESSMPGIRGLPRRKRYLPILAGMLGDVVWFSLLTIAADFLLQASGAGRFLGAVFLALTYTTVLRFLWQFYFYLQTDIYYLITTLLGCVNLQETTRAIIRNAWLRWRGKTDLQTDTSSWAERDRQVARWYLYVYAAGWLWSSAVLLILVLPAMWRIFSHVVAQLSSSAAGASFWDSFVFLVVNVAQYLVVLMLYLRERQMRNKQKSTAKFTFSQKG